MCSVSEESIRFRKVHFSYPITKGSFLAFDDLKVFGPTKDGIFELQIASHVKNKSVFLDESALQDLIDFLKECQEGMKK